jgi:hypothetical protein
MSGLKLWEYPYKIFGDQLTPNAWMDETFPSAWTTTGELAYNMDSHKFLIAYYFKHERDSILFALKWA